MHYTAGRSADSAANWLCSPAAKASAHVVIGRDGKILQLVPFNVVAWHAGASAWRDGDTRLVGMNNYAIGIELDNPGRLVRQGTRWRSLSLGLEYDDSEAILATHKNETQPCGWCLYPAAQLETAFEVASLLVQAYRLKDVIGHDDVAPGRKSDPGPAFSMEQFRGRLFGRANDDDPSRYVTTAAVNVRVGPGTTYAKVIPDPLPAGVNVEVVGREGLWCHVDVIDSVAGVSDIEGWVHGRYLRQVVGPNV